MENETDHNQKNSLGMTMYVAGRAIVAIAVVGALLWGMTIGIDRINWPQYHRPQSRIETPLVEAMEEPAPSPDMASDMPSEIQMDSELPEVLEAEKPLAEFAESVEATEAAEPAIVEEIESIEESHDALAQAPVAKMIVASSAPSSSREPEEPSHGIQPQPAIPMGDAHAPQAISEDERPVGVALVEAIIEPLAYELTERFWGWRPNDVIKVSDNVKNFQLGVLEVTRRAMVQLAQRISRTGSTDAFDPHLENAMSWIMTKATGYWFPSPENKYEESLEELRTYKTNLLNGSAYFYTRADNLIPLFEVFEDLLGSCDQNLVKQMEADGTKVGTFKADDYFYYAKGVAHTMAIILEGVQIDFSKTMENRRSGELLHHAIESCRRAAQMEPWIVTNADLDGILANHRANIAAPISHARFYLGQLIMTLST